MFFGETAINLDAKGRLAIPTRFRGLVDEQCAGRLVDETALSGVGLGHRTDGIPFVRGHADWP